MNTIPVLLTEEEARSFILFQKYRKLFERLDEFGLPSLANGSFTIHLDSTGTLRSIERKETRTWI